jgi:hypothetical protein
VTVVPRWAIAIVGHAALAAASATRLTQTFGAICKIHLPIAKSAASSRSKSLTVSYSDEQHYD